MIDMYYVQTFSADVYLIDIAGICDDQDSAVT